MIKKLAYIAYMCSILEYIVNINLVQPYPNFITMCVHYTKNQAVKKWLPAELYAQYT